MFVAAAPLSAQGTGSALLQSTQHRRSQRARVVTQAAGGNPAVLPIAKMTGKLPSQLAEWQALKEHVKVIMGEGNNCELCSGRAAQHGAHPPDGLDRTDAIHQPSAAGASARAARGCCHRPLCSLNRATACARAKQVIEKTHLRDLVADEARTMELTVEHNGVYCDFTRQRVLPGEGQSARPLRWVHAASRPESCLRASANGRTTVPCECCALILCQHVPNCWNAGSTASDPLLIAICASQRR